MLDRRDCPTRTADRLRRAIADGHLVVHLQPEVRLSDDRVVGFEALVRWDDPGRGLVPPDAFVPLAERTGLIADLERCVFEEACRHLALLQSHSPSPLWMSLNLSACQLTRPGVAHDLARAVEHAGVDPDLIWFEVTETARIEDLDQSAATLRCLRAHGMHVALDDFGTGWSSLERLKRFPAAEMLKIDRSFVRGLGAERIDTEVVASLTQLAEALGMLVVAEGVEVPQQRRLLDELGCDFGQGYLWAPALDVATAAGWLSDRP